MVISEAAIEAAARAIRAVFADRAVRDGMRPTSWDDLKGWVRAGYMEEAEAALKAAQGL